MVRAISNLKLIGGKDVIKKTILDQVKQDKDIIYGSQAVWMRLGLMTQPPNDFDLLTKKNPKKQAVKIERKLDKKFEDDLFYTKSAIHPGTFKVKHIGMDLKKNTRDDVDVVDYSKYSEGVKFNKLDGLNVITLNQIIKNRKAALNNPEGKWRRWKDEKVLNAASSYKRIRRKKW